MLGHIVYTCLSCYLGMQYAHVLSSSVRPVLEFDILMPKTVPILSVNNFKTEARFSFPQWLVPHKKRQYIRTNLTYIF